MLGNEITKQPNGVEVYVSNKLKEANRDKKLDDNSVRILMFLNSSYKEGTEEAKEAFEGLYGDLHKASLPIKVLEGRCTTLGIELDREVKLMMACILTSPGDAVLYACHFAKWCKDRKMTTINLNDWCTNIFPFGTFSESVLHKIWDEQKVHRGENGGSDNLVDYQTAFTTLQNI